MFQPQLLKSALAALSVLQLGAGAVATSDQDKIDYADFEAAMQAAGSFQWEAVPVTSSDGYNLMLFHITADSAEVAIPLTKGPIMLQAGLFSNTLDWLQRSDAGSLPTAL